MTVVNIQDARFMRELKKIAWGDLNFDIDYADIRRQQLNAEPSNEDRIFLGATVRNQIEQLFSFFGLVGEPTSWGALFNNITYCKQLFGFAEIYKETGNLVSTKECAEEWWPGWGVRAEALALGKTEVLIELHKAADTFNMHAKLRNMNPYRTQERY